MIVAVMKQPRDWDCAIADPAHAVRGPAAVFGRVDGAGVLAQVGEPCRWVSTFSPKPLPLVMPGLPAFGTGRRPQHIRAATLERGSGRPLGGGEVEGGGQQGLRVGLARVAEDLVRRSLL